MKTFALMLALLGTIAEAQGSCGISCATNDALTKKPGIVSHLPSVGFPSDPVAGMGVWIDFGDPQQVYQDAALTTLAVADNDPIRGVADKSGNSRKMVMPGGFDPLLWRSVLRGSDAFRHDAVFPQLDSSGWNIGTICTPTACTIFLIGQVPDITTSAMGLGFQGYAGIIYDPINVRSRVSVYNGVTSDVATVEPVVADANTHLVMMRWRVGFLDVAMDDVHDAAVVSTVTIGIDATGINQAVSTTYGVAPYTTRYQTLLIYPTALSEANALLVASWARGRWGIP